SEARLSPNVALVGADQTFWGANTFNSQANVFVGDGSGLNSLNASHFGSGTLADGFLTPNVALLAGNQTFTGAKTFNNPASSFAGNGGGLTNLNATVISSGTVPGARMPALTGDVTSSAGSTATTLAPSGVTSGTYVAATITVDNKGRVLNASAS